MEEKEDFTINFNDLLAVSSCRLENGMPGASVMIDLITVTDESTIDHENIVSLEDADSRFTTYGDVLVMETAMSKETAARCLNGAFDIAKEWTANVMNDEYRNKHELHVVVMPTAFDDKLTFIMHDMMYATFFETEEGYRFITVYSINEENGSIEFFVGEGVDIEALVKNADMEVARELRSIDEEFAAAEERLKALQNENEYEKFLNKTYGGNLFAVGEEDDDDDDDDDIDEDYDDYENDVDDYEPDIRVSGSGTAKKKLDDSWFRISDDD